MKTALLMGGMTALLMLLGMSVGGANGMLIALVIAAGINFYAYWNSDSLALRMYRAQPVDSSHWLYQMTAELAQRAEMPMPKVFIIDNKQPNAFATGRNPENGAVAATTGLLQYLTKEEIAGVMAHELAHIKNRDTLIMTVTSTIASAIAMIANFAMFFGNNRNNNMHPIVILLMSIIAPIAASVVQMAISRSREYEADRIGAEICGNPRWLASALGKIEQLAKGIDNNVAENNPATAHMFIINPLHAHSFDSLFSTHPKTAERIRRLLELSSVENHMEVNSSHSPWA